MALNDIKKSNKQREGRTMKRKSSKLLLVFLIVLVVINISSCTAPVSYEVKGEDVSKTEIDKDSDTKEEITKEVPPDSTKKQTETVTLDTTKSKSESDTKIETESNTETTSKTTTETETKSKIASSSETAVCTRVIDGDTIEIKDQAGKTYKVRYIGIDTPEKGDPYFNEATQANSSLVLNKELRLEKDVSETDKYGRLLRYVYVGDLFVNAHLVAEGFAQASTYPPDVKYADYFLDLQRQAREQGKGLWGITEATAETPKATEEVKQTQQASTETKTAQGGPFVGSKNSDVYHYPSCSSAKKIKKENEIWFNSVEEAKSAGYRPCKVCKPPE